MIQARGLRKHSAGCSKRLRCKAVPDGRTRGVLRLASPAGGEVSGSGDPGERERATLSVRPRAPYLRRWAFIGAPPAAEKGPDARRRPKAAREAYFLYVERAAGGAGPPPMGLYRGPASPRGSCGD